MDEVERSRMPEPRATQGAVAEGGSVDKKRRREAACVADFYSPILNAVRPLSVLAMKNFMFALLGYGLAEFHRTLG